jgi:hypothetical protein
MTNRQVLLSIVAGLLWGLAIVAIVAIASCATTSIHREVVVSAPTALVAGPARGHWAEEDGRPVIAYTVLGNDCGKFDQAPLGAYVRSNDSFLLAPGVTLCAIGLQAREQRVLLHAERP